MAESEYNSDIATGAKTAIIEGSEFSVQTETHDSDEAFEMFCETCLRDGIETAAYAFCNSCIAYFCSTCLKNHGRFLRKHNYIVGDAMYSNLCSEKCETHSKEIIKFYCDTCGRFVCTICKEDLHPDTCSLKYLPDLVNDKEIEGEFEQLHSHHRTFTEKMSDCQKALSTKHEHLSNVFAETHCAIKREKDTLFANFDKKANLIESKIQIIKETDCKNFDNLKETNESLADEIEKLSVKRKKTITPGIRKYKMFVDLKQLKDKVQQAERSFESLSVGRPEPDLEIQAKDILKEVEAFGAWMRSVKPKAPNEEEIVAKKNAYILDDLCVRADRDMEDCAIIDCCMLSEQYLVACDKANRSLKLIDVKLNKLVHEMSVGLAPETVTKIDSERIAFVQRYDNDEDRSKIQFLTLTKAQKLRRQNRFILTEMYCYTVAYIKDDKLIISMSANNEGKVQIIDMYGRVLSDIETNSDGDDIFKVPYCLTVDYRAKYAYVSDWYNDQVIEIDLHSFNTRSVAYMWHPDAIASDAEGFVYVLENGTDKLYYFHPHQNNSEKVEILNDKPLDWEPLCICFCSDEKKLYVGQTEGVSMKVLKITDGVLQGNGS